MSAPLLQGGGLGAAHRVLRLRVPPGRQSRCQPGRSHPEVHLGRDLPPSSCTSSLAGSRFSTGCGTEAPFPLAPGVSVPGQVGGSTWRLASSNEPGSRARDGQVFYSLTSGGIPVTFVVFVGSKQVTGPSPRLSRRSHCIWESPCGSSEWVADTTRPVPSRRLGYRHERGVCCSLTHRWGRRLKTRNGPDEVTDRQRFHSYGGRAGNRAHPRGVAHFPGTVTCPRSAPAGGSGRECGYDHVIKSQLKSGHRPCRPCGGGSADGAVRHDAARRRRVLDCAPGTCIVLLTNKVNKNRFF